MENTFKILTNNEQEGYPVTSTTHQEKKHLIVPVVMIVEGVLHGSRGPLLHLAEEFGKFPEAWNGIPVVINHPQKNGSPISANSPEIIDSITVGRVYNSTIKDYKLVGEVWLDEEKLTTVSPDVLSAVNNQMKIEVSVGVFTDEEILEGSYNDIQYNAIARNHRPDHLALLPGGTGACSVADGCGIRVNNKKEGDQNVNVNENFLNLREARYSIYGVVNNLAEGLKERLDGLRRLVDSLDVQGSENQMGSYHYLEEAFDNYLIYEEHTKDGTKWYKRDYGYDANGIVAFTNDPTEVIKKISYVNLITNNEAMEKKECTPCVKKRVNELIANSASKFTENDREMLETLSEDILDRMIPEAPKPVELSANDKAALEFGKQQMKEIREERIKTIQDNTEVGVWTPEVLNDMSDVMLERVAKSVSKDHVDYSMQAGGSSLGANAKKDVIQPLYPVGVEVKS